MAKMMQEDDPRVKELQNLAWSLQTLSNKPGGRLPEEHKRAAYKVTSKAISLCSDAIYTEEDDFLKRAAILTKQILAKRAEVEQAEEAENKRLAGKCYRASSGGNYVVGERLGVAAASKQDDSSTSQSDLSTSAGSNGRTTPSLSASDIMARCADNPEELRLSNAGMTDSDLDALCEGLRGAGSSLTTLDLSSNMIADAGIQRLVGALAAGMCPKLKELHLGGNSFGPLGSQMLTGGLCALRRSLTVHTATDVGAETSSGAETTGNINPAAATGSALESVETPAEPVAPSVTAQEPLSVAEETRPPQGQALPEAGESGELQPCSAETKPTSVEVIEVPHEEGNGAGGARSSQVRATVPVPEGCATSARDLELDISEHRLVIRALAGRLLADTGLPCAVDPDSAQAAFSRKRRTVTITLQAAC
mmetsp:Transcript_23272/g.66173  ORF Transcript_23272/g.66173 Transcript_23272/m.66173 type:complete len:422 (+) Transcript_23272:72-1337(+)